MEVVISSPLILSLLIISLIWSLPWKGVAMWTAAKHSQKNWFIVILILNTLGILEIIYLFRFAKKRMTFRDLKFWKAKS